MTTGDPRWLLAAAALLTVSVLLCPGRPRDDRVYGYRCRRCGRRINPTRLTALATTCRRCATTSGPGTGSAADILRVGGSHSLPPSSGGDGVVTRAAPGEDSTGRTPTPADPGRDDTATPIPALGHLFASMIGYTVVLLTTFGLPITPEQHAAILDFVIGAWAFGSSIYVIAHRVKSR